MNIEMLAVDFVKLAINKTDYLIPNINTNDKEPSWDGNVEVYRKAADKHAKKDLFLRVPVQVKGHKENNLKKQSISFPIEINDLRSYLEAGGTMFLVCYVDEDGEKNQIYYLKLLPYELRKILDKYGHQGTKTLKLKALPKNKQEIADIFLGMARDIKKQRTNISSEIINLSDLVKSGHMDFSIGYTSVQSKKQEFPFDYFFNHDAYIYAKLPHGIEIAVEHLEKIEAAETTIPANIVAGNRTFYDHYKLIAKKDTVELHFGNSVKHIRNRKTNEQSLTFEATGTLKERTIDQEFFLTALECGQFEVNDIVCPLNEVTPEELESFNIQEHKDQLIWWNTILEALDKLDVVGDLDPSVFTDKDERIIHSVVNSVINNTPISMNTDETDNIEHLFTYGHIDIANLRLYIIGKKQQLADKKYTLCSLKNFKAKVMANDKDDNRYITSIYIVLKKEDYLTCCNIDYHHLLESITSTPMSEAFSGDVNHILLQLLAAYDENKNEAILKAAHGLTKWLLENDKFSSPEILNLNYFQVIKRMRPLDKSEKQIIYNIVENNPENEEYYVGAYLLLDNQDAAEIHFDNMDDETKERFRNYPIFTFWQ